MLYDLALIIGIMVTAAGMTLVGYKVFDFLYWKFYAIRTYYHWKRVNKKKNDDN